MANNVRIQFTIEELDYIVSIMKNYPENTMMYQRLLLKLAKAQITASLTMRNTIASTIDSVNVVKEQIKEEQIQNDQARIMWRSYYNLYNSYLLSKNLIDMEEYQRRLQFYKSKYPDVYIDSVDRMPRNINEISKVQIKQFESINGDTFYKDLENA